METLHFSYNWNNKLDCKVFTTIRIFNEKKHFIGNKLNITYQVKKECLELEPREIVLIHKFTIDKLTPGMAYIDTGYDLLETQKIIYNMYKNQVPDINKTIFCLLFLSKIGH